MSLADVAPRTSRERAAGVIWRVGSWLAGSLPQGIAYRLADAVGYVCFLTRPRTRAAVEQNLCVVLGEPRGSQRTRRLARCVFVNFARAVVDFLMLASSAEEWKERVHLDGGETLVRERKNGRPVVFVSAHIGPWELGAALLSLMGVPLAVVARPHRDRSVDEFFLRMRRRAGLQVLELPGAARDVVTILKQKGCVGMLADRGFGTGKAVQFFGRVARMPWGAVACALHTGASLVPGYTIREQDSWRVVIGRPLRLPRTGDWRQDLERGMRRCLEVLEGFIRRHPEQWFVFEPLWTE